MRALVVFSCMLLCVAYGRADDFHPVKSSKLVLECISKTEIFPKAVDDLKNGVLGENASAYIGSVSACLMQQRGYMDEESGKLDGNKLTEKVAQVGDLINKDKLTEVIEVCVQKANEEDNEGDVALTYLVCTFKNLRTGFYIPS